MNEKEWLNKVITINTKEEYDKVQKELLSKGFKWVDGTDTYYDLFEAVGDFYKIVLIVHKENRTFGWSDIEEMTKKELEKGAKRVC